MLTVITQIGGVVYLIFLGLKNRLKVNALLLFFTLYFFISLVIIPIIAPFYGREKVSNKFNIKSSNYITIILNRNYVKPKLNSLLNKTAKNLELKNIKVRYLDANFPFFDGFPLLPHLSHNDGKKIDLSFIYQSKDGKISSKQKSVSGYGIFEPPNKTEINQINICLNKGFWQYEFSKYLTFGKINNDLIFSKTHTKVLIQTLLKQSETKKIFIEPHLKQRLKLINNKIRYHGCQAVRHDDHIHLQI